MVVQFLYISECIELLDVYNVARRMFAVLLCNIDTKIIRNNIMEGGINSSTNEELVIFPSCLRDNP